MIQSVKLTPELTTAFFDATIASKYSEFTAGDIQFISKQNSNSDDARFNKQFLSNLLAEAESLGLTVRCSEYLAGYIWLNISYGDPDAWHTPGVLRMALNSQSTVFVFSLSFNDFKILDDDDCMSGDCVTDHYKQFSKNTLKKAGWIAQKINNKNVYSSKPKSDFTLALFKEWISKTAKIRDSIEEAERKIEKRKRILELKFDNFSGRAEEIKAIAEEKLPGVKCKLETRASTNTYKLTLHNAVLSSDHPNPLVLTYPASVKNTPIVCVSDVKPQMRTLEKIAMADSRWLYQYYTVKISMDSDGRWRCESDSLIPKFKHEVLSSTDKVVEWCSKLFDAETKGCCA